MSDIVEKAKVAIASYRELMFERPDTHRVKRMLITVNGWCNSKCTFCNIWQYDKALALREEVTLEEFERNLFKAESLRDVLDIGITGGEPFLRRDIVALISSMFRHFTRAHIGAVTNGIRYDRIVDAATQIVADNPGRAFSILVSLDGYGETHDQVRGVPGNFERILKTVTLLKEKVPAVLLGFSHTVTPTSMQDSLRCYELAHELDIGFMYRLAHESPYLRNEGTPIWTQETLATVKPIIEELNRRIVADQSPAARIGNTHYAQLAFYHEMMDYFEKPRRTCECYSGTHSFLLSHDGEVYPCINLAVSMGNIRHQHFDEIWHAPQAEQVRVPIAEWKCHCWTNCETEFSLARQKSVFLKGMRDNLISLFPDVPPQRKRALSPTIPLEPRTQTDEL